MSLNLQIRWNWELKEPADSPAEYVVLLRKFGEVMKGQMSGRQQIVSLPSKRREQRTRRITDYSA